jgi:hypothetical protein
VLIVSRPHDETSEPKQQSGRRERGALLRLLSPLSSRLSDAKKWEEDAKSPLEELLARIVKEIRRHYAEAQKRRAQEAIEREKQRVESERRWKEYQEKEAVRQEEERKRKHTEAIEAVMQCRKDDLLKAAEWWRLHEIAKDFIVVCEQRWRGEQADQLTLKQDEWLRWAQRTVKVLSPFEAGYPEPHKDGAFSPQAISLGGPYPETRGFPRPPTMSVVETVLTAR